MRFSLSLDIFTQKLGSEPVCALAVKLQLKMYDSAPLEGGVKKSTLGYANTRDGRSRLRRLVAHLPRVAWKMTPTDSEQRTGPARSHLPQPVPIRGVFILCPKL